MTSDSAQAIRIGRRLHLALRARALSHRAGRRALRCAAAFVAARDGAAGLKADSG